jgi:tRNA pseudouridine55 synthase
MTKNLEHNLILPTTANQTAGILLVNKPEGKTSFSLISALRKRSGVKKIGHAGTLDPFASGVMILLIGRNFTRLSNQFINYDKEYRATICLGEVTDTHDPEGKILSRSSYTPSLEEVERALQAFQGEVLQIPPMYSAKKIKGQTLYKLARQGKEIERKPVKVTLVTTLLGYEYPHIELSISCSKGTYIRTIAHDLGQSLTCGAYLKNLSRTRCGPYTLDQCIDGSVLYSI